MRVRVEKQTEDARLIRDSDGVLVLALRKGLMPKRAVLALTLLLAQLAEHGSQYVQGASQLIIR